MWKQTDSDLIEQVIRKSIENNEIAGANLKIIQKGEEIFYHQDGYRDLAEKLPIQRDTIFRLYSMSKPVTAAATMILLERGAFDLFDPVSKYLPGFRDQKVEENGKLVPLIREMNIKDLLGMTSGLVYGGTDNAAGRTTQELWQQVDEILLGDSPMGTVEFVNELGKCPLAFQPGTRWEYGLSADVLGALIEVISGMRYGEFLQKELFEPLHMEDTAFWVHPERRHRLAKTYANDGSGGLELYTGNHLGIIHQLDRDPGFESGGAGLASTIDDYSKFARMLMRGGSTDGVQILKPRTVKYLTSCTLEEHQQSYFSQWHTFSGHTYGNLMRVMTDPTKAGTIGSLGEYGWDGWLGAYFCNCPKDDLTMLFMIQKKDAGTTDLTRKLRNCILSTLCE